MTRIPTLLAPGVAVPLVVSACGGSRERSATPSSAATPSSSAPTSESASPSPTPTTQPTGRYGVTFHVLNWDQYSTDSAVLAWKQNEEDFNASVNRGTPTPGLRSTMTGQALRVSLSGLRRGVAEGWTTKKVGQMKVQAVVHRGNDATLVACLWAPTTDVYHDGHVVGGLQRVWRRVTSQMHRTDGRWVISTVVFAKQNCPGGAPGGG